jgi:hypothetical protein
MKGDRYVPESIGCDLAVHLDCNRLRSVRLEAKALTWPYAMRLRPHYGRSRTRRSTSPVEVGAT